MASSSTTKAALARRAWRLLFDFIIRTGPERTAALARRGLTPNDSRALSSLSTGEGRTMRALADEWGCDASNATWIVDRLERLGLAERRGVAHDRRVKLVVLTPEGQRTRDALLAEFYTPPAALQQLSRDELATLERALEKLAAPEGDSTRSD